MNDKSSTSLAIISLLSIVVVFFIAVSNVENAPVRRPFAGQAVEPSATEQTILPSKPWGLSKEEDTAPQVTDQFSDNFGDFIETLSTSQPRPENGTATAPVIVPILAETPEVSVANTGETSSLMVAQINTGVNSQLLSGVGFKNFVIKPRPFDGVLFGLFEVPMLTYLNVIDKEVMESLEGRERQILRIYQFTFDDSDGAQEIYSYLRSDLKGQLGLSINETNQFGLASFFINFNTPQSSAFLVVKTKTNVYALSYPKDVSGESIGFEKISRLLSVLGES